jgi:hypothetical protein
MPELREKSDVSSKQKSTSKHQKSQTVRQRESAEFLAEKRRLHDLYKASLSLEFNELRAEFCSDTSFQEYCSSIIFPKQHGHCLRNSLILMSIFLVVFVIPLVAFATFASAAAFCPWPTKSAFKYGDIRTLQNHDNLVSRSPQGPMFILYLELNVAIW